MDAQKEVALYNVRLTDREKGTLFQIQIKDGKFVSIENQKESGPRAVPLSQIQKQLAAYSAIDIEGRLLLPSFIDLHTHLDKAFSLAAVPNASGTLEEAVHNYSTRVHLFKQEEIKKRVVRAALQSLSFGTTHIRTHVNFEMDVHPALAIEHLQAVLEARQELRDFISIQVVPMFSRLYGRTPQELELVEEAIRMGVDGIGGAPHLFPYAKENIHLLMKLADKHDKFLDLHVDENDDPAVCTLDYLINLTEAYGFQGRVVAGHLCSLAAMGEMKAKSLMERMVQANVAAVTLPGANMYLQGRGDRGIIRRGITRVKELKDHGVKIATASDNVNDPFHPFGRGDLLQIGLLTAYTAHMASKSEMNDLLKMMTTTPAALYGLTDHQITEQAAANFTIVDAADMYDLFASLPSTRYVYGNGRWLSGAHTSVTFQSGQLSALWKEIKQEEVSKV